MNVRRQRFAAVTPFCVIGPVSIALSIWGQAWSNAHPAVSTALDLGLRLAAAIPFWPWRRAPLAEP